MTLKIIQTCFQKMAFRLKLLPPLAELHHRANNPKRLNLVLGILETTLGTLHTLKMPGKIRPLGLQRLTIQLKLKLVPLELNPKRRNHGPRCPNLVLGMRERMSLTLLTLTMLGRIRMMERELLRLSLS
uniref:Uncharacterized protein n=1 Tax=Opuntia streptacantha TaxID=393608 RepID=A0A7C9AU49_OPUST